MSFRTAMTRVARPTAGMLVALAAWSASAQGVRPDAQVELAAAGERMRVYVPYGTQWYGYFMRRLAERPANVAFFLRALATRS